MNQPKIWSSILYASKSVPNSCPKMNESWWQTHGFSRKLFRGIRNVVFFISSSAFCRKLNKNGWWYFFNKNQPICFPFPSLAATTKAAAATTATAASPIPAPTATPSTTTTTTIATATAATAATAATISPATTTAITTPTSTTSAVAAAIATTSTIVALQRPKNMGSEVVVTTLCNLKLGPCRENSGILTLMSHILKLWQYRDSTEKARCSKSHTLDWLNTGRKMQTLTWVYSNNLRATKMLRPRVQFASWRGLKRIPMLIILLAVRSVFRCILNVLSLFAALLLQDYTYSFWLNPVFPRWDHVKPTFLLIKISRIPKLKGRMAGLAVAPATFSSILSWPNSVALPTGKRTVCYGTWS